MLSDVQKIEIDQIFKTYSDNGEVLIEKLEAYKEADGSFSLYIRWRIDSLFHDDNNQSPKQ